MASICKRIVIEASPEEVWSALRDWGALHERLAPGFVTDTRLDGPDRIVTFFDGAVVREVLMGLDEQERRLAWSIVDGPYTHHAGAAMVHERDDGSTLFEWRADLLPDQLAERTADMMASGLEAIRTAFARSVA
jgi:hypothetical protein